MNKIIILKGGHLSVFSKSFLRIFSIHWLVYVVSKEMLNIRVLYVHFIPDLLSVLDRTKLSWTFRKRALIVNGGLFLPFLFLFIYWGKKSRVSNRKYFLKTKPWSLYKSILDLLLQVLWILYIIFFQFSLLAVIIS